ncbi:MAG: aspartate aminotransferase family protein [Candidatus Thorarchaeota archaeon]
MLEKYKQATPKSRDLWSRALKVFAGGVNHNIRTFGMVSPGAYPPYIKRGTGSKIWDEDGNEYVDWWMTHYSHILGHNHPRVGKAIQKQMEDCIHLGALNEHQVIFAEKIQEAIPYLKRMRFCATGSEAAMYAVRLARLFTGKRLVAKARGGWHGGSDALGYHISFPFSDDPFYDGVSFEFNDSNSVNLLLKKHGKELAAIVVEPVLGAGGGIPPEPDFLPYLREETEARGILLIFDEIITGFRLRYGAAGKDIFNAEPDLLTLGKIAAGGMPLGVYGGREDVMALAAPGAKGGRWVGGGTFSSHPLSMVSGIATLDQLHSLSDDYASLNKRGEDFRERLNHILVNKNVNALATGYGSMLFINCLKHDIGSATLTGGSIGAVFDKRGQDIFQAMLMEQGVFGYHGLGALSFEHSEQDLERTLEAVSVAAEKLKQTM